ncbi:glycogen synthase GlgA [Hydrogenophaga pseudoflava]|uniref:glycogen synthase GlgA n=1 Tax=Hydrogenophaga pseudoflava TaxID=47421 RepID=UPI0027E3FA29|nr:glycogen synthase GlgA [Hydrogenophaga pseudoflava]MDQ7743693.1 glycogen synthase GlgA [Hydrogenophaga pseudoflava]
MRVLYVCSEVFPLLKTGGLADVSAGLPPALAAQGADVRLLLPAFPSIVAGVVPEGPSLLVPSGDTVGLPPGLGPRPDTVNGPTPWLQHGRIEASGLPVLLLHAPGLYDRPGNPYQDAGGKPWPDAAEQFAWLGWAAALLGTGLDSGWVPDVVHGHDWHTGLAFAYLNRLVAAGHRRPATVFTVHNLAYQGVFGPQVRARLGLPDALFHLHGLEFHGQVSFMKAGLQFADALTTVSPTYAREITGEEQGCGLDGVLRERRDRLHGILNGVDDAVWDPANDALVQPGYSAEDLRGKAAAKVRLQQRLGLQESPDALLFCVVSRLTEQKGLHLLPGVVDELVHRGGQLAVLGAGDPLIEQALQHAAQRHPGAVGLHIGYDEALAHTLIAGSDVILVPSRFEPCGLTQLYGLRYGTLPLVRAVGGLVDTVTDSSLENIDDGRASGFVFHGLTEAELRAAIRRAFALRRREADWRTVQRHAMSLRFDWARAATDTLKVYAQARTDATGTASA